MKLPTKKKPMDDTTGTGDDLSITHVIEALAIERKRLESVIAAKKIELSNAQRELEQFDSQTRDIRTHPSFF